MKELIKKLANKVIIETITDILNKALAAQYIGKEAYNSLAKLCQDKGIKIEQI